MAFAFFTYCGTWLVEKLNQVDTDCYVLLQGVSEMLQEMAWKSFM
jgi:hypothetical protein